jgi:hypothetical protein
MTHDPMCHLSRETGEFNPMADRCYYCKLIAKVRADALEQAARRVSEVFWPTDGTWVTDQTTFDNLGLAAVSAARGDS